MHIFHRVVCQRIIIIGVMSVFVREDADPTYYIIGVLAVSRQMHHFLVAVGVENQAVFNKKRVVFIVRVYRHLDEHVKTVVSINLRVFERRSRHSIHVDAVRGGVALFETYRIDFQVLRVVVVDHQHPCRRADAGEHGVEGYGVGRQADVLRWAIGEIMFLAARDRYQDNG